jgi:hypothetical protein
MLDTISDGLRGFLEDNVHKLSPHMRPSPGVHELLDWMAEYFLRMHHAFVEPAAAFPRGWTAAVEEARAVSRLRGPALVLTFQVGFPLLLPIVLERATDGPVAPIIHEENAHALSLYARHLRSGAHIDVTAVTRERLERELARGAILAANVDTAYPGTRSTTSIPFLGGRLRTPTGLVDYALGAGIPIFAAALVSAAGRLTFAATGPLAGSSEAVVAAYGRFFESLVRDHPVQWMGWAGLDVGGGPGAGELIGSGCEGDVRLVREPSGRRLRVKSFARRAELERYVVGAAALAEALRRTGWERHVALPEVLAVDRARRLVTSRYVPAVAPPWPDDVRADRARAVTALVCAAGVVAELPAVEVEAIARGRWPGLVGGMTRFWLDGVDANEGNFVFDGTRWHAVDF